jgi:hypothetical protein
VHPLCQPLAATRHGPFLDMPDGGLLTIDAQGLRTSQDEGPTWSEATPVCPGVPPKEPAAHYIVRTRTGTLVMLYLDMGKDWKFTWDDATGEPKDGCRLELWSIRSEDSGKGERHGVPPRTRGRHHQLFLSGVVKLKGQSQSPVQLLELLR